MGVQKMKKGGERRDEKMNVVWHFNPNRLLEKSAFILEKE